MTGLVEHVAGSIVNIGRDSHARNKLVARGSTERQPSVGFHATAFVCGAGCFTSRLSSPHEQKLNHTRTCTHTHTYQEYNRLVGCRVLLLGLLSMRSRATTRNKPTPTLTPTRSMIVSWGVVSGLSSLSLGSICSRACSLATVLALSVYGCICVGRWLGDVATSSLLPPIY